LLQARLRTGYNGGTQTGSPTRCVPRERRTAPAGAAARATDDRVVSSRDGSTPMPSPFPGMDPYLEDEKLWPVFHHQFVACLHQLLLPGLVDRYRARTGQRHYVTEQALFTSIIRDEHHEEFIEIRQRQDGKLVTL